jgi:hypothetical protein
MTFFGDPKSRRDPISSNCSNEERRRFVIAVIAAAFPINFISLEYTTRR